MRCVCDWPDHKYVGSVQHRDTDTTTITYHCVSCDATWTHETHIEYDIPEPAGFCEDGE